MIIPTVFNKNTLIIVSNSKHHVNINNTHMLREEDTVKVERF